MKILSNIWKLPVFGGVCLYKREYFNSHRFPAMSSWIFIIQRYQRRNPWGQMLYFRFGYPHRKWGLLQDYLKSVQLRLWCIARWTITVIAPMMFSANSVITTVNFSMWDHHRLLKLIARGWTKWRDSYLLSAGSFGSWYTETSVTSS